MWSFWEEWGSESRDLAGVWQLGNIVIVGVDPEEGRLGISVLPVLQPSSFGQGVELQGAVVVSGERRPRSPASAANRFKSKNIRIYCFVFFLFHLTSLQRLCLMSYPCLKCGIYLLLLLPHCKGATRLFVWISPARITLCSGTGLPRPHPL